MTQVFKYITVFIIGGLCSLFITICAHDNLCETIFYEEKETTYNEEEHELIITLKVYDGHGQGIFSGENIHHAFWNYEKYTKGHKKTIKIGLYNCRLAKFNANLAHADKDGNIILRIPRVYIPSLNEVEISINGRSISSS